MKKFFKGLLFITTIWVMNGCHKPDEVGLVETAKTARQSADVRKINVDNSIKGDYELRDGLIRFKTVETFVSLDRQLRTLNPKDRAVFTQKLGFKSLLDVQLAAYDLLEKAESKDQYDQALSSYKDILESKAGEVTSVFDEVSAALLNREGMVSIGGIVHCFAKTQTITASDVEKVRTAYKTGVKADTTVRILRKPDKKSAAGARVAQGACATFDQTAEANGNRRVNCTVVLERRAFQVSPGMYDLEYYAKVVGTPQKKSFFSGWVGYSTGNTLQSRFTATFFFEKIIIGTGFENYPTVFGLDVNNTRSNDGSLIDYYATAGTQYQVPEFYAFPPAWAIPAFDYFNPIKTLYDANPFGVYSSGGVPAGVEMKCF